ncbi:MAG: hypothetical protein ACPGJV_10585 [Bacteriovoracaceae bacterium]
MKKLVLIIFCSFLFSLSTESYSASKSRYGQGNPVVGEVVSINGSADRMFLVSTPMVNKRKRKALRVGSKVLLKDLIITEKNSHLAVQFFDGTRVFLNESSSIELRKFELSKNRLKRKVVVYQNWGKVRMNLKENRGLVDLSFLETKFYRVELENGSNVLSNIYQIEGRTKNDVLMLSRSANVMAKMGKHRGKRIFVGTGEVFTDDQLSKTINWWGLPKVPIHVLKHFQRNAWNFLPRLQVLRRLKKRNVLESELHQFISLRQSAIRRTKLPN